MRAAVVRLPNAVVAAARLTGIHVMGWAGQSQVFAPPPLDRGRAARTYFIIAMHIVSAPSMRAAAVRLPNAAIAAARIGGMHLMG